MPPVRELGALAAPRRCDEALHRRDAARIGERAHLGSRLEPVADLDRLGALRRSCRRTPRRRSSCTRKRVGAMQTWPALRNLAAASDLRRARDVGVVEHDCRRVPAELHRGALHVQSGQRCELLAHCGRAGERHLPDDRMRDQVFGNLRRHAEHQIDARPQARPHRRTRGPVLPATPAFPRAP